MSPQAAALSIPDKRVRARRADVRLRPGVEYGLLRSSAKDVERWMPEVLDLVKASHDGQLLLRSRQRLARHMRHGEMVLLIAKGRKGEQLVGIAVSALDDDTGLLEIAHAVVHPDWRGERLATLLSSAALIGQALNEPELCAYMTLRPDNLECAAALHAAEIPIVEARDFLGSLPMLDDAIQERRRVYWSRGWQHDPLIGVVTPEALAAAARMVFQASRPTGLSWTGGAVVRLLGPWCDQGPEPGEGVLPQLKALADGQLPRMTLFEVRRRGVATVLAAAA